MTAAGGDPLRVLYSFPHTLGRPGIATTALHQVRGLLAAGVEVTVVCTTNAAPLPGTRVVETLRLLGRRVPHRAFLATQRAYDYHDQVTARLLRRERDRFDLVHTWPRGCLRTIAAARSIGVRAVREVPSPHTAVALRDAADAAAALGLTLPATHSHAADAGVLARELAEFEASDVLLVPSEYAAGTFLAEGVPAEKLARTRYGFDADVYRPRERPADRPFTAVFAGRGEPNKGLHLALDAWLASGAAEDGELVVAGRIWPEYGALLERQLAHPSVRAPGFVSDMPGLLAGADVLLLPTFTEGSALVTYEALGAGCVPLVSSAAGAPVRDGVDGLVHEPGDLGTLTAQLKSVYADRARLAELRAAAVAARDELTWTAAGRHLAEVYRSLVSTV